MLDQSKKGVQGEAMKKLLELNRMEEISWRENLELFGFKKGTKIPSSSTKWPILGEESI